ncbi:MAG: response regulator transcription factor [Salinibacter sp.]
MIEEKNAPSPSPDDSIEERTEVFLVDDHPAIREALTAAINSKIGMSVVGESATADKAMYFLQRHAPDIVVVDISLNDAHGLDLIRDIRAQFPDVRVIVFSMHDEHVYAERAIRAGASGYVMKAEPPHTVVDAIQTVGRGDVYLSRRITSRILGKVIRQEDYLETSDIEKLTDRELTVFEKLGEGLSVREIAAQLELSRKTVETYRRRAKEKLDFETVAELLQYAVQWIHGREGSSGLSRSDDPENEAQANA